MAAHAVRTSPLGNTAREVFGNPQTNPTRAELIDTLAAEFEAEALRQPAGI